LRVLAILFGIILLLPGLCSLGFMAFMLPAAFREGGGANPLVLLWLVCFAISYGGILMIRYGVRGERDRTPQPPSSNQSINKDE
jgi:hypothetical protein